MVEWQNANINAVIRKVEISVHTGQRQIEVPFRAHLAPRQGPETMS